MYGVSERNSPLLAAALPCIVPFLESGFSPMVIRLISVFDQMELPAFVPPFAWNCDLAYIGAQTPLKL